LSYTKSVISKKFDEIEFDLDSFKDKSYLTHNFHSYPAKFVPQIPKIVIEKLSKPGDVVLDPFCGSGTTLVEAKLTGRLSIGLDINPISILTSKCKTISLTKSQFSLINKTVEKIYDDFNLHAKEGKKSNYYHIPKIYNLDLWFQKNVQIELGIIKKNVEFLRDEKVKNFLLTAFSSIITPVSNQISDTKYASIKKDIMTGETINKFTQKVSSMKRRLKEFSEKAHDVQCKIYNCSATSMKPIGDSKIDLIVTSPPYANTYDYYLYHRHRMEWLEYDSKSPQSLEIGSRNKHSDEDMAIESYLSSMKTSMKELYRVLKKNKFFCIVIGDAIKDKNLIQMDKEFLKLGKELGFTVKQCFSYDLRKYSSHFRWIGKTSDKKGHIIIFEKGTVK